MEKMSHTCFDMQQATQGNDDATSMFVDLVTIYGKRNLARSQPTIDQICFAMEFTLAIGQTVRFAKARGTKAYRWYRKKQVMTETINM